MNSVIQINKRTVNIVSGLENSIGKYPEIKETIVRNWKLSEDFGSGERLWVSKQGPSL